MNKKLLLARLYFVGLMLMLIGAWQVLVQVGKINPFFFSSPKEILKEMGIMFGTGMIWEHIAYTMYASFWGLFYGIILGVAVAFIFGNVKVLADIFDPLFVGLNGLPKLALGPLLIMWFGIGIQAKIFMAGIMVFFLVFFNAYAGFKNVDPNLINTLKLMGASRMQIVLKVVLPSCVPWIIASLRAGVGAAVLGAIVGEYLGATKGLGWLVQSAGGVYNIARVLACIVILMIIMSFLDFIVKKIENYILRWRPTS